MSYDFSFFSDQVRDEHGARLAHFGDTRNSPPDPQKEALKKRVAAALMMQAPALEPFAFDYDRLAQKHGISAEAARNRYRHIQLNYPVGDDKGVQINLFDDEYSITVAYWHQGAKAREVLQEVWRCLKTIQEQTGFAAYDDQFARTLDLAADFENVVDLYTNSVLRARAVVAQSKGRKNTPWWKFWKR